MSADFRIRDARGAADIAAVRALLEEYRDSLDVDLCFQNFAQELAGLPGDYAPPAGGLLVAELGGRVVGCVALRPLGDDRRIGEVKRLYVQPALRGTGAGRALAGSIIERARGIGYRELRLDTLATMAQARSLYASLGFRDCAPYYHNPLHGTAYMALVL